MKGTARSTTINGLYIEAPKGYLIDLDATTFSKLVYVREQPELPKRWEDVDFTEAYAINGQKALPFSFRSTEFFTSTLFSSKREALAVRSLAKLSILKNIYNQGSTPDFTVMEEGRSCIVFVSEIPLVQKCGTRRQFLTFYKEDIAIEFLRNFEDIIFNARSLL